MLIRFCPEEIEESGGNHYYAIDILRHYQLENSPYYGYFFPLCTTNKNPYKALTMYDFNAIFYGRCDEDMRQQAILEGFLKSKPV